MPGDYRNRKIRILYVEDNIIEIRLVTMFLKQKDKDIDIKVFDNGDDAIDYLLKVIPLKKKEKPNLILLDMDLPRKTGLEILEIIKGNPILKTIPVIFLSYTDTEKDIAKAYKLGASCYLVKPSSLSGFKETIDSFWELWFNYVELPSLN